MSKENGLGEKKKFTSRPYIVSKTLSFILDFLPPEQQQICPFVMKAVSFALPYVIPHSLEKHMTPELFMVKSDLLIVL